MHTPSGDLIYKDIYVISGQILINYDDVADVLRIMYELTTKQNEHIITLVQVVLHGVFNAAAVSDSMMDPMHTAYT